LNFIQYNTLSLKISINIAFLIPKFLSTINMFSGILSIQKYKIYSISRTQLSECQIVVSNKSVMNRPGPTRPWRSFNANISATMDHSKRNYLAWKFANLHKIYASNFDSFWDVLNLVKFFFFSNILEICQDFGIF